MFRSFVIPHQAAILHPLSIAAALGVTVATFQYGWLGSRVGVAPGRSTRLPVVLFAIVFGLGGRTWAFPRSRPRRRDVSATAGSAPGG